MHGRDDMPTSSSELWTPKEHRFTHLSEDELWWNFTEYIKHERRFIFGRDLHDLPFGDPRDWLPPILPEIETQISVTTDIFRARRNAATLWTAYPPTEMAAPPVEKTINGRVSPAGIRVFYGALERDTAVYEVRPPNGARVTVARVYARTPLRIVDLRKTLAINPFGKSPDDLQRQLGKNAFLRCLDTAFSKPISATDALVDYTPTQYVTEVIKNDGFAGIIYKSSLREAGANIVLFDPDSVAIKSPTELVEITSTSVAFRTIM